MRCGGGAGVGVAVGDGAGEAAGLAIEDGAGAGDGDACAWAACVLAAAIRANANSDKSFFKVFPSAKIELSGNAGYRSDRVQRRRPDGSTFPAIVHSSVANVRQKPSS